MSSPKRTAIGSVAYLRELRKRNTNPPAKWTFRTRGVNSTSQTGVQVNRSGRCAWARTMHQSTNIAAAGARPSVELRRRGRGPVGGRTARSPRRHRGPRTVSARMSAPPHGRGRSARDRAWKVLRGATHTQLRDLARQSAEDETRGPARVGRAAARGGRGLGGSSTSRRAMMLAGSSLGSSFSAARDAGVRGNRCGAPRFRQD